MGLNQQLALLEKSIEALQSTLQGTVNETDEVDTSTPSQTDGSQDIEQISQQSALLPAQFQTLIAALSEAQLSPTVEQPINTCQTEAHRRLRLIGIAVMQLRTAKQPARIARGRSQLSAHVSQLQQFVQAMRVALGDPKEESVEE